MRRLCEEGLAQQGEPPIRLSLHAAQIRQFFGVETPLLARLVDVRLLRAEAGKGGGATYELPHDTLLGAVLEAKGCGWRRKRKEAEARAAAQREAEPAAARAQAAREKRRRQRAAFLAWGAGLAAVVAIGLALFARQKMAEAEESTRAATEALERMREAERARLQIEIGKYLNSAEKMRKAGDIDMAKQILLAAPLMDSTQRDVRVDSLLNELK